MSIWVRLIGGAHNDQIVKVDEDQLEQVMRESVPMGHSGRNFGLSPSTCAIKAVRYTRREVRTPAGVVVYYALDSLSDLEALQSVLGP